MATFGGDTPDSYYDEGLTASMKGDLAQAVEYFERCIRMDNKHAAAYHQLGKCYYRLGQPKKAVNLLAQVIAVKPKMIPARVDLAWAKLAMGSTAEAQQLFSDITLEKPDNAKALLGLAQCAFDEGQWESAMAQAQQTVLIGGANFGAFYLLGRAAKLADRAEVYPEALKRAEALMEKSIESNPDAPEGYFLRGEVRFVQEDFSKALDDYRAAEDRAESAKHYSAYGEHFTRLDMIAKRGICLQRLGKAEAAQEAGEKLLKADPENRIGRMLIGAEAPGE